MLPFTNSSLVSLAPSSLFPLQCHVTSSMVTRHRPRPARRFSVVVRRRWCGVVRRCSDLEGDLELEAEILEFMAGSEAFPSRKELVEAGRIDLVEAIVKQGGWLSLGWDLGEQDEEDDKGNVYERWNGVYESSGDDIGVYADAHSPDSSSDRSIEAAAATEFDTGIEGILSRLNKERNLTLGFVWRGKEDSTSLDNDDKKHDPYPATNATVGASSRSIRTASSNPSKVGLNDMEGIPNHRKSVLDADIQRNSLKPDTWRAWSTQRAGSSALEFEAGDVSYDERGGSKQVSPDEKLQTKEGSDNLDGRKELECHNVMVNYKQVRSRMQHLESELSSVLNSLRSKTIHVPPNEMDHERIESSSGDSRNLSDAWEFQENEIMHAQSKLRSTRAKLAVLEGKMAMAIIEAQKKVEEKQKRVNDARRALRLLRTALIVWTSSASEVLLAGSYDGWATQRKMERSSTGIFSVSLKLYPGRYEIKFIVDGEWRIDPLRPIVRNNRFENNILIIT